MKVRRVKEEKRSDINKEINKEKRELLKKIGLVGGLAFLSSLVPSKAEVLINNSGVFKDGMEYSMGGIPYRIVAASNASAESKAKADYVCDGTNDEVEIRQAIADIDSAGGGIVFLTEGTFNLQDNCYTSNLSNPLIVLGSGWNTTRINFSASCYFIYSSVTNMSKGIVLRDIKFTNPSTSSKGCIFGGNSGESSGNILIQNCRFEKVAYFIQRALSGNNIMENVYIKDMIRIFTFSVANCNYEWKFINSYISSTSIFKAGIANSNVSFYNSYISSTSKWSDYDHSFDAIYIYNSVVNIPTLNMKGGNFYIYNSKIENLGGMQGGNLLLINSEIKSVSDLDKVNLTIGSIL